MTDIEMLWYDMETTGLDAMKDVPLEVGVILTDRWGNVAGQKSWLIWEVNEDYLLAADRARHNEFVNEMHTKSGLFEELTNFHTMTRAKAQLLIIQWLADKGVVAGTLPMCGNSIGSLDRPFTIHHMPALNEFLHYRNIDMSTIKEICKLVNPELFEQLKPIIGTKADATHRVLGDCRASIREYTTYLDEFLIVP